ncbi:MAG: S8 family serine peptidase [Clostridia bacterium]|nr:S8 family serine peptidase [Clostridia bacterium]
MNRFKKRILSVGFIALLCVLFCLPSFAATTNEYGLGLTTGQQANKYTVTLKNQNSFPVNGVSVTCELPDGLRSSGKTNAEAKTFAAGQRLELKLPLTEASGFIGSNGTGIPKSTALAVVTAVVVIAAAAVLAGLLRRRKAAKAVAAALAVLLLLPCFSLLQVNAWGVPLDKSFTLQDTVTLDGQEYPVTVTVKYTASSAKNSYFETTVAPPVEDGSTVTEYITSLSGQTVAAGRVQKVTYEMAAAIDNYEPEVSGEAVLDGCAWSVDRFDLKPGDNKITVTSFLDDGRTQSETYHLTYDKGRVFTCDQSELRQEGEVEYVKGLVNVFFKNGTAPERADEIIHALGGVRVGEVYASDLYQARVDAQNLAELQEYCNRFTQFEEVRLAIIERTVELETNAVPNDPWMMSNVTWNFDYPQGYNWSVTAVNAMGAWDYNSYMNHVNLGMVDSSIFTSHADFDDLIRFADSDDYLNDYAGDNINLNKAQHGTHVAGTMGATADNNLGITGLLWDTNIYAANFSKSGLFTYVIEAVVDEILAGAKAVNLSLGATNNYKSSNGRNPYLNPISDATLGYYAELCIAMLTDVIEDGKEFVVVQSAGNGVQDTRLGYTNTSGASQDSSWFRSVDAYQNGLFCSIQKKAYDYGSTDGGVTAAEATAVYDRVIVVGAAQNISDTTNGARYKMWFRSNGGSRVDIYAPGVTTVSTSVDTGGTISTYAGMTGTSQAAPIVTAVAGACFAINPNLTGAQVKQIICSPSNSDRIVEDNTDLFTGTPQSSDAELEYHPFTGDGRLINMKLCVEEALRSVSTRANYSELNTYVGVANNLVPTDYTNFDTVQAVLDVIDYNRYSFEQDIVDGWAQDLATAIYALNPIYADYTAVDAAIAAANALTPSDYTNFDAVTAAVSAVRRNKLLSQQAAVDAMAQAINDAVANLIPYVPEEPMPETDNSDIVIDNGERVIVTTSENAANLATVLTATQGYTVTGQVNENGNYSTGAVIVLSKAGCDDIVYQVAVLGDVNGDDAVDGFDAYLVGLYDAGLLPAPQGVWLLASDTDCDGALTGEDKLLLERCALQEDVLINLYQPADE